MLRFKGPVALLHYFKDSYINNWRTRRFLKFTIEFCIKKENYSHAIFTEKISKIDSILLSVSDLVFRTCVFPSSVTSFLRRVYVRLLSAAASKKLRPAHSLTQRSTIVFFFSAKNVTITNTSIKLNSKTGKRRREYITRTISLTLLPFPVPLGTTVCFTAFRHPKFSMQIFMELMHRTFKFCRQNVLFL